MRVLQSQSCGRVRSSLRRTACRRLRYARRPPRRRHSHSPPAWPSPDHEDEILPQAGSGRTNDGQARGVDFHDLLKWRGFQGNQRGHDFREAGGWEPAGRIFLQQDAPGLSSTMIQGRCLDDRLLRQIGKRVFSEASDQATPPGPSCHGKQQRPAEQPPLHAAVRLLTEQALHEIGGLVHPDSRPALPVPAPASLAGSPLQASCPVFWCWAEVFRSCLDDPSADQDGPYPPSCRPCRIS